MTRLIMLVLLVVPLLAAAVVPAVSAAGAGQASAPVSAASSAASAVVSPDLDPAATERQRAAELERQRTLAAAEAARQQAHQLVEAETARLRGLLAELTRFGTGLAEERTALGARRTTLLGWQQRVKDVHTALGGATPANLAAVHADADATFDALNQTLRDTRDALRQALDQLDAGQSALPPLGADRLAGLPAEVSSATASELRHQVDQQLRRLRSEERALQDERAKALLDEAQALIHARIDLLPDLSPERHNAVIGFGAVGWSQASSEARHLLLVLRYHRHVAEQWLGTLRGLGPGAVSGWTLAAVLIPWLLLVLIFIGWKRRSQQLLDLLDERLAAMDRAERLASPSPARRLVRFLTAIHRPLDALLLFGATVWLLPQGAKDLLEVQLLKLVVGWVLTGALVVNVINALAAAGPGGVGYLEPHGAAELRLRSLQLVGRVVVGLALILVLSDQLVGQGTLYEWVLTLCWLAALPVFLQLVQWWRETVFVRVERVRRKSPFQAWVLANRSGWTSFIAAMLAGVHLFVLGAVKVGRNWLAGFDLVRRVHAYLFRRELARLADQREQARLGPLPPALLDHLSPARCGAQQVASPLDEAQAELLAAWRRGRGGVLAVVASRGMGGTTLLRRIATEVPAARLLDARDATILPTLHALAADADQAAATAPDDAPGDAPDDAPADHAPGMTAPQLLLIDNAQALLRPVMGGLRDFDALLALARASRGATLWVLAIDAVLWPFLARARDARPLFDEVLHLPAWDEQQIATLLTQRSEEAGLQPGFADLLDKLPPGADEIDRLEALAAKRSGYFRMVWDYARGNPGLALEVWRSSLALADDGSVHVRPLQVPDTRAVEALPDAVLFILRAVLQLPRARIDDIAAVTHLSADEVHSTVRVGQRHGYLVEREGCIEVPWRWLRIVHLLLERRHLLLLP